MAVLVAVAALHLVKVARLSAVASHMAFLTTVAATTAATATLGTVAREVAHYP